MRRPPAGDARCCRQACAGRQRCGRAAARGDDAPSSRALGFGAPVRGGCYWPTRPSMRSRSRSACPLWRAYSSIMCTSSSRSETGSPSESQPTKPRSWSRVNCSAKAISSRHAACASSDDGRVGDRPVEVGVGVGVGLVPLWYVEPGEPAAEPGAFHLGHVPDQAEQGHRGRFHGPAGQLPGVQPGALQLQRQPLAAQELVQRRPLVPQPRAAFARVGAGIEEQVRPVLRGRHADLRYRRARAAAGRRAACLACWRGGLPVDADTPSRAADHPTGATPSPGGGPNGRGPNSRPDKAAGTPPARHRLLA